MIAYSYSGKSEIVLAEEHHANTVSKIVTPGTKSGYMVVLYSYIDVQSKYNIQ